MNKFVLALLLAAMNTGAWAQALWQGTEYGMTVNQVRQTVVGVVAPEDPKHLGDAKGRDGIELLRLPNVELVGRSFDAQFFFKDDRLVQVTLSSKEQLTFDSMRNTVYDSLLQALRAKYGPELSAKRDQVGILRSWDNKWMSGRTNINLFMMAIQQEPAILSVIYQVRIAKEADKL